MSDLTAKILTAAVSKVEEWAKSPDTNDVYLKLVQPDGNEFILSIPTKALYEMILALANATALFVNKDEPYLKSTVFGASRVDVFRPPEFGGDWCLRFRLLNGGLLTFSLEPHMARLLAESMKVDILGETPPPSVGTA